MRREESARALGANEICNGAVHFYFITWFVHFVIVR